MSQHSHIECGSTVAQQLTGKAVLLEIGARLELLDPLLARSAAVPALIAAETNVREEFVSAYYAALARAGIVTVSSVNGTVRYTACEDLRQSINDAGYVLWGVMSCAPLIEHARAFADNQPAAIEAFPRNGEHVGRTSKWMGEADFYPHAELAIQAACPKKIVDLGSGTCGLLIRCLRKLPKATALGIDLNPDACSKATASIAAAGLSDRIKVLHRPIESLIQDSSPLAGAGVIHAGFVLHDLVTDQSDLLNELLSAIRSAEPTATLIIVDAVPYATDHEREFSAVFTFLHSHFMGRRLMPEDEWRARLADAGYANVEVEPVGIAGGRRFTATTQ